VITILDQFNDAHQFRWGGTDVGVVYTGKLNIQEPRAFEGLFVTRVILNLHETLTRD